MKCPNCKNQIQKDQSRCPFCYARIHPAQQNSPDIGSTPSKNQPDFIIGNIKAIHKEKIKRVLPYVVIFDAFALLITSTLVANYKMPVFLLFLLLFDLAALKVTIDLAIALRGLLWPLTDSLFKRLARYGDSNRIQWLMKEEINQSTKIGDHNLITPKFLICCDISHFQIAPLEDLIWVYDRQYARESFFEHVLTDYKLKRYSITFSQKDEALIALETIEKRCPGIVAGSKRTYNRYVRQNAESIHQKVRGSWVVSPEIK